ncbi:MAG: smpB [Chlamydiia bacterium]|nr:smpB [Chlamydiia bacterium]
MTNEEKPRIQELVTNRRATFEYEVLETIEAGIVLQGTEIKSLRDHGGSLQESYIMANHTELLLISATISPYRFGSIYNHDEKRKRKLLVHKRELRHIEESIRLKGLTCIPLSMYLKNGRVKVKIAIAKGKKVHDKRAAIQERDDKRAIQRHLKNL